MKTRKTLKRFMAITALAASAVAVGASAAPAGATVPGDNGKIYFNTDRDGNYEIYATTTDRRAEQTNLTNDPAFDRVPSVSPDGQKVVFVSNRGGNTDLWTMNADGSEPVQLTDDARAEGQPVWSPDMKRIAFVAKSNGTSRVHVVRADGTGGLRAHGPRFAVLDPGAFGDLVVTRAMAIAKDPLEIGQVPPELEPDPPLPPDPDPDPDPIVELDPAWSPNGERIAFASKRGGASDYEIYSVRLSGKGFKQLTNNARVDRYPTWSPDGTSIVYTHGTSGFLGKQRLWMMNADGTGNNTMLTDTTAVTARGTCDRSTRLQVYAIREPSAESCT